MTTPLSVVIAARNAEDTIGSQLEALLSQPWPNGGEIIVADNGSTDRTAEVAASFRHGPVPVEVIDCRDIRGAGHARNAGVLRSSYDFIGFCDADDIVDVRWVAELGKALETTPAVGGRLALDEINPEWTKGSRGRDQGTTQLPLFDGIFPVLSSCNLGIHRSTFTGLDGFDESPQFIGAEDADFSLRLHESGVRTDFAENAVVHYRLRSTIRSIYTQARAWGEIQYLLRRRLPQPARRGQTLRSWLWLAAHPHLLRTQSGRARLAYVAGTRIGVLRGSIRPRGAQ